MHLKTILAVSLFWWAELNFGQDPVFLKASVCKLFPEKLFSSSTKLSRIFSLLLAACGNLSDEWRTNH